MNKRYLLLLPLISLVASCGSHSNGNKAPYFQHIADMVESGINEEITFDTFYDKVDNRFNVTFHYDLHFGLALKVEEYDLWNNIFHINEGVINEGYESITFTYSGLETSDLFTRGEYVLSHELVNNIDKFSLITPTSTLSLTKQSKEPPHYIDKGLVGEFEYEDYFSIRIDVGEKSEHYPVTITLWEGDNTFSGANITNNGMTTSFNITGDSDGEYIKKNTQASISYIEENDSYILTISNVTYVLVKTKGIDDHSDNNDNFFFNHVGTLSLSCLDFKVSITSKMGNDYIYLLFNELVDNGNPSFVCLFAMEEDTIYNFQNITNSNNKIFINHDKYVFKHYLDNNVDKVDLYFDGVLTYQDLTITISD